MHQQNSVIEARSDQPGSFSADISRQDTPAASSDKIRSVAVLEVDVAIIGAGTAGMAAYRAAARHSERVALIEGAHYGTTCARVGCMPSKLLIAAAEAAHAIQEAPRFGVSGGALTVDGKAVMERVRRERDRFVGFVERSVNEFPPQHKLWGHAVFLDRHTLRVQGPDGDSIVKARAIVIATGSRPKIPRMFEGLGDRLLINDDIFGWETLPQSVVVFGPGVIGLELGQALHRLGVRVRVLGVDGKVGPMTDPVIQQEARALFGREFPLHPEAKVSKLERVGNEVELTFRTAGPDQNGQEQPLLTERFEYVLVAVGRVPNLDKLHLEQVLNAPADGVPTTERTEQTAPALALDGRGVPVYNRSTLQWQNSHIFIAGDATVDLPLLHEAADEGRIAGENAARFPLVEAHPRRSALAVVFSDPQLGMVGSTFAEVKALNPVIGTVSFDDQGRSRVMGLNRGLMRIYADRWSGRFLGAEFIGPRAEHLAHLLAWAHQSGLTIDEMLERPFYHPVIEEGVRTALRDASAQLKITMRTATAQA